MLVLRWFRAAACVPCLARDAGVSQATGYRYLHEGIDVLTAPAPHRHEALQRRRTDGMSHVILDGTLIACDRVGVSRGRATTCGTPARPSTSPETSSSSPHRAAPRWGSCDVEPGSVHDLTAARLHALPALYAAARPGLPTLADVGDTGAGSGVYTPFRPHPDLRSPLAADTRPHNRLLRGIRSLGDRAASELKQWCRARQHVTRSPNRIGAIAQAAPALNNAWKKAERTSLTG